ncbi:MAG: DUF5717 family protein [Defluviitaleaceae bacterium]|nr:DUF5717 family protein [Defluviitaleaceae bacterium]
MTLNKRLPFLEQFPQPKLNISETKISLRGFGLIYGAIEISNAGDGVLAGSIASISDFLSFSPESFEGNKVTIEYTLDLGGISGEILANAVVTSSGGERVIDFHIIVNPPDVLERDGYVMADLSDFAEYARTNTIAARSLFARHEFMVWLLNMNYSQLDIYEKIAADPNKERALDNFLVFNGEKMKAKILPETRDLSHSISITDTAITGSIVLRKTTWGFAECSLEVIQGEKWLKLSKSKLVSSDFDDENLTQIHYIIMPEYLSERETAIVTIDGEGNEKVHIRASFAPAFSARLDKQSFFFDDKGKLIIENNTGHDLLIDINCENYVKFAARRYHIGKMAEIDFEIKFGSFKQASLSFKKQMYAETFIHVVAIDAGKTYGKRMELTLWGG